MGFAIFYNLDDLEPLSIQALRPELSQADKTLARKLWDGGIKNWQTAPIWTGPQAGNDPDCRIIVINVPGVTAQDMINLLRRIALLPGAEFMNAIADDMSCFARPECSGCREPWP